MPNLHNRYAKNMRLRGVPLVTQYKYLMNLKSFETCFSKYTETLDWDELRDFPLYLVNGKKISSLYASR